MRLDLTGLAVVAMALAGGCGPGGGAVAPAAAPAAAPVKPVDLDATLVFARGSDSKKLDPADVTDGESVVVVDQLFEKLITQAPSTADLVADLATTWDVSSDGLTITFHLRPGVKFHDGTPCDAAAVKFSLDRLRDPANPHRHGGEFAYGSEFAVIAAIETPFPQTVVLHLKTPSAVLLPNLATYAAAIVSPAAVQQHGAEFARNPVGTGPYKFAKWIPGEKVVVDRFDGYWGEKAKNARVIFVPIPEQSARLERLKRGEAHMMNNVDFAMVEEIRANPALRYDMIDGMNFAYLAMNCQRKPFTDARVRQAVAFALDKDVLRKQAYFGFGKSGPNPMPPTVFGYHETLADRTRDLAKAKGLLAEAGFPSGLDVDFWAMPNPRPYMPKPSECAQVIKSQLAEIGIRCTIKSPPWPEYLDKTGNGEHPLCVLGWTTDNGDPDNFLAVHLHARNAKTPGAQNRSFYTDADVAKWLDEAAATTDAVARKALYVKAQEKIFADCPMVPLAYLPEGMAMRQEVRGYVLNPTGTVRLSTVTIDKP